MIATLPSSNPMVCSPLLLSSLPRPACGERSDRPCDPGEGVQVPLLSQFAVRAPHPNPLPAKCGARECTALALLTQHRFPALDHGDATRFHLTLAREDVAVLPQFHRHGHVRTGQTGN